MIKYNFAHKAVVFVVFTLLVVSGWGFETDSASTVKNDLTVNGNTTLGDDGTDKITVNGSIERTACKENYTLVDNSLCIQTSSNGKGTMNQAILVCRGAGGRVCSYEDMLYVCQRQTGGSHFVDKDMWLGNYVGNNDFARTDRDECNSTDQYDIDGDRARWTDKRTYRCCY